MRILAMTPDSDLWNTWIAGHDAIIERLDAGDRAGAVERYKQIYVEFRAKVEAILFD
jgi:DNA-binding GntR family transcriptional regulator